jgi:DNA-binding CsgD family transcriptional regulator
LLIGPIARNQFTNSAAAIASAPTAIGAVAAFLEATRGAGPWFIASLFDATIQALGFGHFTIRLNTPATGEDKPSGRIWTYPKAWEEHANASGYALISPTRMTAMRLRRPFNWFEAVAQSTLSEAQRRIYREAAEFSIGLGLTVPIISRDDAPTLISINSDPSLDPTADAIRAHERKALLLGLGLFERIEPVLGDRQMALREARPTTVAANDNAPSRQSTSGAEIRHELTPFERECLIWAAFQIDDAAIAARFSLPEIMVRQALEVARIKLGAASREHAVVRALAHGLIAL